MPERTAAWGYLAGMPVLATLLAAVSLGLAGCTCVPLVEVDACFEDRRDCVVEPEEIRTWDAAAAQQWPRLDAIMEGLEPGDHAHPPWQGDADAFWRSMGVDPQSSQKRVYVERGDELFGIRILPC